MSSTSGAEFRVLFQLAHMPAQCPVGREQTRAAASASVPTTCRCPTRSHDRRFAFGSLQHCRTKDAFNAARIAWHTFTEAAGIAWSRSAVSRASPSAAVHAAATPSCSRWIPPRVPGRRTLPPAIGVIRRAREFRRCARRPRGCDPGRRPGQETTSASANSARTARPMLASRWRHSLVLRRTPLGLHRNHHIDRLLRFGAIDDCDSPSTAPGGHGTRPRGPPPALAAAQ